jgi:phosphomannomutase / phosphoglucomutase
MSIYKACDIRGKVGEELTPELYRRLGRGLAILMGDQRSIVVGGDGRQSTPELKASLIDGLASLGKHVVDIGLVPTPVVYFARHLAFYGRGTQRPDACAIVTASHNPPGDNGLKFMIGEWPVLPGDIMALRALAEGRQADDAESVGEVEEMAVLPNYVPWISNAACQLGPDDEACRRELKVVVDAGNGISGLIAPGAFRSLPDITVAELFCEVDGTFPNRHPNTAIPENLTALCDEVRRQGADLGVAFDGDGDRVAFVDEAGVVLDADETAVLFLRGLGHMVNDRSVVHDLKCSSVLAREAVALGGQPLMEKSGHAYIKACMNRTRAIFGAEVSGHYFHDRLRGGDDGLFSAILMTRFLQARDESLSAWRQSVPARFITQDIRLSVAAAAIPGFFDAVRNGFDDAMLNDLDGLRVEFDNGWALIRQSITEPKITLRFEGDSQEALDAIVDRFLDAVPEIRDAVKEELA